jgi:hypothetical protein
MNNKFYLSVLFFLSIFISQLNCVENMNLGDDSEVLDLASRYINFINRIGCGEDSKGEDADALFAPECRKHFNGRWVAESRQAFVDDLLSVYKNYGSWKLIPNDVIQVADRNSIILWINIEAESFGANTALVILRYDASGLIEEIIEVFSPVQKVYDFK